MKTRFFLAGFFFLVYLSAKATTWNEPWADSVIKKASSFVLARIVSSDPQRGIKIIIIKTLGGQDLRDSLLIDRFYLLYLCSRSGGEGPEFQTVKSDSCYFFIRKDQAGKFSIATPTTGFDYASDGNVAATFRHSYHQALVPAEIYERAMTAIFNHYHHMPYDKDFITGYITTYLRQKPAGYSKEEIKTFFAQHVALECIYHLKLQVDNELVLPFLNDSANFHNQVSGARALCASANVQEAAQGLVRIVADSARDGFVKVMCIWSLKLLKPTGLKVQLASLEAKASDEGNDFGGNIMDPRVCTRLPSVKEALKELTNTL